MAILAIGSSVYPALEAAAKLAEDGIQCSVVNARFAKPLDSDLILGLAKDTGCLVTVEENALSGGFGSAVLQLVQAEGPADVQVESIGLPDRFGDQETLRSTFNLDSGGIARFIRKAFPGLFIHAGKNESDVSFR
jgi:1-deoxy-D-xylulose-5-phosphate synthase